MTDFRSSFTTRILQDSSTCWMCLHMFTYRISVLEGKSMFVLETWLTHYWGVGGDLAHVESDRWIKQVRLSVLLDFLINTSKKKMQMVWYQYLYHGTLLQPHCEQVWTGVSVLQFFEKAAENVKENVGDDIQTDQLIKDTCRNVLEHVSSLPVLSPPVLICVYLHGYHGFLWYHH